MKINTTNTPIFISEPNLTDSIVSSVKIAAIHSGTTLPSDLLANIKKGNFVKVASKLNDLTKSNGQYQSSAAFILLDAAMQGLAMTSIFEIKSLRNILPSDLLEKVHACELFESIEKLVRIERPRWTNEESHIQLLLATDCRTIQNFNIFDFETLHSSLIKKGIFPKTFGITLAPYLLLRTIEAIPGSVLTRELRHAYILWRASGSDETISFSEFRETGYEETMRVHGHRRERVELNKQQVQRRKLEVNRKSLNKLEKEDSPYLKNLKTIAAQFDDAASSTYFGALSNGSQAKGFRPEFWLSKPTNYPGREHINVSIIGAIWFKAFNAFLAHRKKSYETYSQIRGALHLLADYILLYLPWWIEAHPGTSIKIPDSPKQFIRLLYFNRTHFHEEINDTKEKNTPKSLPKTLTELLPLRRETAYSRNYTRVALNQFFNFSKIYFEDDDLILGKNFKNPINLEFDNEVAGRPGKTNKISFTDDVYPLLIYYCQAIEAFGEYLQQLAYETDAFKRLGHGPIEGYETSTWGYMPLFWHSGKCYHVGWIPNLFHIAKRIIDKNPPGTAGIYVQGIKINTGISGNRTLSMPHLTTNRMLNTIVELGIRGQSAQWLDRNTFDKNASPLTKLLDLFGRVVEQDYHALFVNTDKTNDAFKTFMSWRIRRSLTAEKFFQESLKDRHCSSRISYEGRDNTRFDDITSLFRSEKGPYPITDNTYRRRWIELLFGFEKFLNEKVSSNENKNNLVYKMLEINPASVDGDKIHLRYYPIHPPHACRATYASLKDGELELDEIAAQLGHGTTIATRYYQTPSEKKLKKKLKKFDDQMFTQIYDPIGDDGSFIQTDNLFSPVRIAFEKNRSQTILDFGFVSGVSLWSLSDLDEKASSIELLRESPSSIIRWHATHVCPVGNQCPKEVVLDAGGLYRCGICPLAAKCIDHLPAMEAKQNELKVRIRTAALKIKSLQIDNQNQSAIDILHQEMRLDTKETLGWKLSCEILRAKQSELASSTTEFHVDQPELVRKQLQLVTRKSSESEFFLRCIAECNAWPSLSSPSVRIKAERYTRIMMAQEGRLDEASGFNTSNPNELTVFASLLKPFIAVNNLSISDLANAIDSVSDADKSIKVYGKSLLDID